MRYKIGYDFPYFQQKYLQHAHSHFAFAGWVSQALMVFMVYHLGQAQGQAAYPKYRLYLLGNLVLAFGMLFTFAAQGYQAVSIAMSTASVLLGYMFGFRYIQDMRGLDSFVARHWFIMAWVFNVVSSLGTYVLAYMMASKQFDQTLYLGSVYWYLHFQYNGWFFFALVGLFLQHLQLQGVSLKVPRWLWLGLGISCVPAYGLSMLWIKLPLGLYILALGAAVVQLVLLLWLGLQVLGRRKLLQFSSAGTKWLLMVVVLALAIKLGLQVLSAIPALNTYAFGLRPIVIAYLHLVLLGLVSMYLIYHLLEQSFVYWSKLTGWGIGLLVLGFVGTELLLVLQGLALVGNIGNLYSPLGLLLSSVTMVAGQIVQLISAYRSVRKSS